MRIAGGRWGSSKAESRSAEIAGDRRGCCTFVLHRFDRQSESTVKTALTLEG